jgi:hypothetical protein
MTTEMSVSSHKLSLARDYLDDVELGRLAPENLLLKGIRLARFLGDDETRQWLFYELSGFVADHPVSLKYMTLTGRRMEGEKTLACWDSLTQIDTRIALHKLQIQQLYAHGPDMAPPAAKGRERIGDLKGRQTGERLSAGVDWLSEHLHHENTRITQLSGIRSRVLALIHDFASRTYYALAFGSLQETFFERQKKLIEAHLADTLGPILEKVPDIYDRLAQMTPEAVHQAFGTCRQIIEAFADSIYPPTEENIQFDGKELPLTAEHFRNRIYAFLHRHCENSPRRQRLQHALDDLYSRVRSGAEADRTAEEARFLILQTFMLMGEILSLKE